MWAVPLVAYTSSLVFMSFTCLKEEFLLYYLTHRKEQVLPSRNHLALPGSFECPLVEFRPATNGEWPTPRGQSGCSIRPAGYLSSLARRNAVTRLCVRSLFPQNIQMINGKESLKHSDI